jgi:hypothetical protein
MGNRRDPVDASKIGRSRVREMLSDGTAAA